MRNYSPIISLTKNSRGIYSLDTSIGCKSGMENELGGCYNDCYAAKSAKLYGYDFSKTILRSFKDEKHRKKIVIQISKIPMPFIRIGTSGDPSENWAHTLKILEQIQGCNKEIVIITKHWTNLTLNQINSLSKMNVCVNTSVSALDKKELRENCICQHKRMSKSFKCILRIVSCDFNKDHTEGLKFSKIQDSLFKNKNVIDTILRVNKSNKLISNEIINVEKTKFLGKNAIVSKYKKSTYFGIVRRSLMSLAPPLDFSRHNQYTFLPCSMEGN